VAHLDVKPQNILVDKYGNAKLADFGCAKQTRQEEPYGCAVGCAFRKQNTEDCADKEKTALITQTPGTPAFTAPECCKGDPFHGPKADMWALGMTLHALLTGSYFFLTNSQWTTYQMVMAVPPDLQFLHFSKHTRHLDESSGFIGGLLQYCVKRRLTAREALAHPWMKEIINCKNALQ